MQFRSHMHVITHIGFHSLGNFFQKSMTVGRGGEEGRGVNINTVACILQSFSKLFAFLCFFKLWEGCRGH